MRTMTIEIDDGSERRDLNRLPLGKGRILWADQGLAAGNTT